MFFDTMNSIKLRDVPFETQGGAMVFSEKNILAPNMWEKNILAQASPKKNILALERPKYFLPYNNSNEYLMRFKWAILFSGAV